ncbi:MAG: putative sulfate exporter family transporter [Acidobacteriota bacterium]|nr:putative sulfate exporter family transporter [Acidobacteriota bacterium]
MRAWKKLVTVEDWWAVWIGFLVLGAVFLGVVSAVPKIPKWQTLDEVLAAVPGVPLLLLMIGLGGLSVLAMGAIQRQAGRFAVGFPVLFCLALLSFLVAGNRSLAAYGLSYALWALLIGLAWSNLLGVPSWLKPSVRSELFIKTGLVILGAEIIFGNILTLGRYGVLVAWGVTPVVLVSMFWFGYRRLKLAPSFAVTIAAATSVCGVSAAIAAASASKAKKEELTLAVAMTLIFTVLMMVLMPLVCRWMELDMIVAGAWLGGTIDSTGAVVAAGQMLGDQSMQAAAVIKMIQNASIGLVALLIALYWVTRVEPNEGRRPGAIEIWNRFPKFVLGFIAASCVVSLVLVPLLGTESVGQSLQASKAIRTWLFCLAFLCIGLESDFRALARQMAGGRPLLLYWSGQTLNIVLTLLAAWLAFSGILFPKIVLEIP